MDDLSIRNLRPDPALAGVVTTAIDYTERTGAPVRRTELPLLGAVLHVTLGPEIVVGDEHLGSFAAGLWDGPVVTGHDGAQAGYMLYLDPLGAAGLLRMPVRELTNVSVALEDVLGPLAGELEERLAAARGADERHAIAQRLLARRLAGRPSPPRELRHVVRRLDATHGGARVEALAAEVGWSRRHLTGRFREELGLAPKTVARLARVAHAASLLRAGGDLAGIAYACGYADQPHFNRDVREFTGRTPGELRAAHVEHSAA
jgi:AraC-like DNA-binding protein